MSFAFVEKHRNELPMNRLCQIMHVSLRGYRSWRSRPMNCSQRRDLVVLTHIREQFALSLGSYGRPRVTEELKDLDVDVGHPLPTGDCLQSPIGALRPPDARKRDLCEAEQEVQGNHGQQSLFQRRAELAGS